MLKETKEIFKQLGCKEVVEAVEHGFCPGCSKAVVLEDFEDQLSKDEFEISGLCQYCQNMIFTGTIGQLFPKGVRPAKGVKIYLH